MSNFKSIVRRFQTLGLACALLGGCASELSPSQLADLENEGPYSPEASSRANEVDSSAQALKGIANTNGFLRATSNTAAVQTLPDVFTYNMKAAANSVTRLGQGRYRVSLPKLVAPGNAQVVAFGENANRCMLFGKPYAVEGGVRFDVYCFTVAGVLADTDFSTYYDSGSVSDKASAIGAVVSSKLTDNAYASAVTKTATGQYNISLHASIGATGTPFVTAIGANASYCNPSGMGDSKGYFLNVRCFNAAGAAVDSNFSFLVMNEASFARINAGSGRASSATGGGVMGYYDATHAWEMVYFENTATGVYNVQFPSLTFEWPVTGLVSAFTTASHTCKPSFVGAKKGVPVLTVRCFDRNGAPISVRSSAAILGFTETTDGALFPDSSYYE